MIVYRIMYLSQVFWGVVMVLEKVYGEITNTLESGIDVVPGINIAPSEF